LPILLAVPFLVVYALIHFAGNLEAPLGYSPQLASRYFGNMIQPWPWLDLLFLAAAGYAVLAFSISIRHAWRGFMQSGVQPDVTPKRSLGVSLWMAIKDILAHAKFQQCGAGHARRIPHMLILFGFGALFLTTVLVFVGMYFGFGLQTPLALDHPIKILGNAGTVAIALGLILAIVHRSNPAERVEYGRSAYQDVLFLTVLTLVVLTGLTSQLFRLGAFHVEAAVSYFLHLGFILFLFVYAPYSKFAHVIYFATALTWAHRVGRELKTLPAEALPDQPAPSSASKAESQKAA
jgi:quinone-modifying oxidoreductase subunit QmoC